MLRPLAEIASLCLPRGYIGKTVLQETPVPGSGSRRQRLAHVSHSSFAGYPHHSPSGSQLSLDW